MQRYKQSCHLKKHSGCAYENSNHTSGIHFGINKPIGHDNYYPNAGSNQPRCESFEISLPIFWCDSNLLNNKNASLANKDFSFDSVLNIMCSHGMAHTYFIKSIANSFSYCGFRAYKCSSYSDYMNGVCASCKMNYMGFFSEKEPYYNPELANFYIYLDFQMFFNSFWFFLKKIELYQYS